MDLSKIMGIGLSGDLGKYLGIPLLHSRASYNHFKPILGKVQLKLSGWKGKMLILAGRSTLIKSVLTALPNYHMQTMLLPKKLLIEVEKASKSFLWGSLENEKKSSFGHMGYGEETPRRRWIGG